MPELDRGRQPRGAGADDQDCNAQALLRRKVQSSEICACLATSPNRCESAASASENAMADPVKGTNPTAASFSRTSGSRSAFATSCSMRWAIGLATPRGAKMPTIALASKSAGPAAAFVVGTSGKPGSFSGAAIARYLTFFARYSDAVVAAVPIAQSTSPVATAL